MSTSVNSSLVGVFFYWEVQFLVNGKSIFTNLLPITLYASFENLNGKIEHLKRLVGSLSLWIVPIYILSIAKISAHFVL